jgi:hypothetical protein
MRRTGAAAGPRRKGEPSLIPRRDIGRRYYGLSCRKPLRSGSGVLDFWDFVDWGSNGGRL